MTSEPPGDWLYVAMTFECLAVELTEMHAFVEQVESFDLLVDCKSHHTDSYRTAQAVLRRGQPFDFSVKFNHRLDENVKAAVMLMTGRSPCPSKGTDHVSSGRRKRLHDCDTVISLFHPVS